MSQDAKNAIDLLDWAETLLCNALPMDHCPMSDWNKYVRSWRDQKHALGRPLPGMFNPKSQDVLGNPETTPTQLPVELKEELL